MKILTIDTSGEFATVTVTDTDSKKTVTEVSHDVMSHLRLLIPMIQKALDKAGIKKEEITHIAAAVGPGSFTGIRIGLATAKVMAQMMNLPIIPLSSLEIYAYADYTSRDENMRVTVLSEGAAAECTAVEGIAAEGAAAKDTASENTYEKTVIVPMINARHGNVFASAYVTNTASASASESPAPLAASSPGSATESPAPTAATSSAPTPASTHVSALAALRATGKDSGYSRLIYEDLYNTRNLAEKIISETDCKKIIFTADASNEPFESISATAAAVAAASAAAAERSEKSGACCYVVTLSEEQRALALADMAVAKAAAGKICTYNEIKPVYLRKSEAERKLEEKRETERAAARKAAEETIFELPPEDEEITYRNADERDAEELAKLDALCFKTAWSTESFDGELDPAKNSVYRVAVNSQGSIIGFAGVMCIFDEGEVNRVAVSPLYRGRRIAVKLMDDIIKAAEEKGVRKMFLEVREANRTAIALYKENGFRVTGKRENYYRETGENALMMKRESKESGSTVNSGKTADLESVGNAVDPENTTNSGRASDFENEKESEEK